MQQQSAMAKPKQVFASFQTKFILFALYLATLHCNVINSLPAFQEGKISVPQFEEDPTFPRFTQLGQIGGLATDKEGKLHIFHRGDRVRDSSSFDKNNQLIDKTIVRDDAIVVVDSSSGQKLYSWGANRFYMPHGIFIDDVGNTWVTDVGLHQVLRYSPGKHRLTLAIGKAFEPGPGKDHLCKPTDVYVTKSGIVFISDGECNSRILVYNTKGKFLRKIGENYGMKLLHSLTVIPQYNNAICVADRSSWRILCFSSGLDCRTPSNQLVNVIKEPMFGLVQAIRRLGNQLMAVVGRDKKNSSRNTHITMFDLASTAPSSIFTTDAGLVEPHAIAVTPDEKNVFIGERSAFDIPRRIIKLTVYN